DSSSGSSSQAEEPRGTGAGIPRREKGDPLAMGDVDAPVTLIEYADFRCPFCGVFARDTVPELEKYVEDGTLRIEWRDFPIFGEQSFVAARAARAAAEQDHFWEFYETVFANAPERGHPDLTTDKLIGYAEEAGVPDMAKFKQDMDDRSYDKAIKADRQEAITLGMTGTPGFVIGDQIIVGAQPASVFIDLIESLTDK
ncbi:MAG: thioredoxin domain-containing protein, partial [Actinomycetia bacterium]|nr:thioredoxin domain-containing protein [Actinomycetes bacterium]